MKRLHIPPYDPSPQAWERRLANRAAWNDFDRRCETAHVDCRVVLAMLVETGYRRRAYERALERRVRRIGLNANGQSLLRLSRALESFLSDAERLQADDLIPSQIRRDLAARLERFKTRYLWPRTHRGGGERHRPGEPWLVSFVTSLWPLLHGNQRLKLIVDALHLADHGNVVTPNQVRHIVRTHMLRDSRAH